MRTANRTLIASLSLWLIATAAHAASLVIVPINGLQLWPKVNGIAYVYYVIDSASDPAATSKIQAAILQSNNDFPTLLKWVPWSMSDGANYVDINLSADDFTGQCEANEGYEARPAQPMTGSTSCTEGTILHEMGHVIGLLHEQSRADRGTYVSVKYTDVIKGSWDNFLPKTDNDQILGPYDYASVMQYIPFAFTRNGGPVIESIPAGIPLSGYEGVPSQYNSNTMPYGPATPTPDYSAQDKEAIERLYGAAPTQVTVTSNPVGLQVIVDGTSVTTPQTYAWALWSTHTLGVAAAVQTLNGDVLNSGDPTLMIDPAPATYYYTYGRWNDSTAQSHSITVTPGNGSPTFPVTSPLLATYSANFVQLIPYTMAISPTASGTVSVSPQPQNYPGAAGTYFVARSEVTLTATASTGWSFYEFNNSPFFLPGAVSANPKSFYAPDTGNPVDTTTEFSNMAVYTVNVVPNTFSSNLGITIDNNDFFYAPKNFSPAYDAAWTAGSTHTIAVQAVQSPYSLNSRYNFVRWSDGGAASHKTKPLPAKSTVYNATVTPEYMPVTNFSAPPCGGSAELSPVSPSGDGFYPTGTQLSFSATPAAGWTFAGWTYDVTGTANPATLTANGETLVYANFNIVAAPLTLTALQPSTAKAGAKAFTLKLVGTGFSPNSLVSANGQFRTVTYVNEQTLTVPMTEEDVASGGAFSVYVENFPPGSSGCAVFGYETFIVAGAGALTPTPVITPKSGTYSAAQMVSISDAAAGATIYYTLDGTAPTTGSPTYSNPFTVSATTTVKARAEDTGFRLSGVATANYTIEPLAATPVLAPVPGKYTAAQSVMITDATSGATIYYTTDGTAPTTSSSVYSSPIAINSTTVLKAAAKSTVSARSAIAGGTYTIQ